MKDIALLLLFIVIALTVMLFFGPIVAIVSLIGRIEIGSLKIDLKNVGWLRRVILGIIGVAVWLSVYIPLVSLASQRLVETSTQIPPTAVVNTSAVIPADAPMSTPTQTHLSIPVNQITATSPTTQQTAFEAITPSPTSVLSIKDGCINPQIWTPSPGNHSKDIRGCWDLLSWGISAQKDKGLLFFLKQPSKDESHGIFTAIPTNEVIEFSIQVDKLTTSENARVTNVLFGIVPLDSPDPANGIIFAFQVETVGQDFLFLKVREFGKKQKYLQPHYDFEVVHTVKFQLEGLLLTISVDGDSKISEAISIPFRERALWIGYTVPSGGNLSAFLSLPQK